MLPRAPGHSATVLVALATIGGTPSPTSAGNVSSVPPPAIELTAPATAEARTTRGRRSAAERSKAGSGVSTPKNSRPGLVPCRFRHHRGEPGMTKTGTRTAPSAARDDTNGADALDIRDTRTDRTYSIPILPPGTEGDTSIRAMDLRQIKTSSEEFGLMTYDPAFMNTASCKSAITYIDGDKGILRYRGYPIEQLAENATFLEIAWLLR